MASNSAFLEEPLSAFFASARELPTDVVLVRHGAADHLNKVSCAYLSREGRLHVSGAELGVNLRCPDRFIQRQTYLCATKESFGDRIFARFAERNLPQQQGFSLMQLAGSNVFRTHLVQVALNQRSRLRDILWIAAVGDGVAGPGLGRFQADVNVVNVACHLPQIMVKTRCVKTPA